MLSLNNFNKSLEGVIYKTGNIQHKIVYIWKKITLKSESKEVGANMAH